MKYSEIPRSEDKDILVEEVRFPIEYDLLTPLEPKGSRSIARYAGSPQWPTSSSVTRKAAAWRSPSACSR